MLSTCQCLSKILLELDNLVITICNAELKSLGQSLWCVRVSLHYMT